MIILNEFKEFIPIIGSLVAALTAGIITFVISVLSKEQKISDFRHSWVEELRKDISEFMSEVDTLKTYIDLRLKHEESKERMYEFLFGTSNSTANIGALFIRIKLRLSHEEHGDFIKDLKSLEHCFHKNMMSDKVYEETTERLIENSHRILKQEWKRVKRGEPVFFTMKWISLSIFVTGIIALPTYIIVNL